MKAKLPKKKTMRPISIGFEREIFKKISDMARSNNLSFADVARHFIKKGIDA